MRKTNLTVTNELFNFCKGKITNTLCGNFQWVFQGGKKVIKSPLLLYRISFKKLLSKVLNEHGKVT